MFVEHMRCAIAAAPRERLAELAGAVWRAYAAGAVGEGDAQALAEAVEARRAAPPTKAARRAGSRPRAPESLERRRRWVASGLMPPQVAVRFTMGEGAALAVIAAEVGRRGLCRLPLGQIAALAGVCRSTVRNAVRQAVALGLIRSEEWRISAWRSAPNTVTILSAEWSAWLRLGRRRGVGANPSHPRVQVRSLESETRQKDSKGLAEGRSDLRNPPGSRSDAFGRGQASSMGSPSGARGP